MDDGIGHTAKPENEDAEQANADDRERDRETLARLETEIDLLNAMYPEQIVFDADQHKLTYYPEPGDASPEKTASSNIHSKSYLTLQLPTKYPAAGLPKVQAARNANGKNMQPAFAATLATLPLHQGIETLDEILAAFTTYLADNPATTTHENTNPSPTPQPQPHDPANQTTIIWLHHLLATSKRKHALAPPSPAVAGIAKPGAPGVMIFSGPAPDVRAHVAALKALNWQAFQVRYEGEGEQWAFAHGRGMAEVASMSEVVGAVVGEEHKGVVLAALRLK